MKTSEHMKSAFFIFFLSTVSLFAAPPWPGVQYTEVRAYAWPNTTPSEAELIKPDMSLLEGVLNRDGTLLNAKQTKRLLAAEAHRWTPRGVAGCYSPHNAFVFYNAGKKPVAFLEICFDCFGSRSSPADDECDPDFVALATIFSELKLPFGRKKTLDDVRKSWGVIETNEKLLKLQGK